MSSNSVFINYRRSASAYLAQLVWRELTDAGIDAFYDINSIDAGQFDQITLNQIAARPYFMPILSPGTLERCKDPGDWVLREMQEALRLKRVIVPLVTEAFNFDMLDKCLPAEVVQALRQAEPVRLISKTAVATLRETCSNRFPPVDVALAPVPPENEAIVAQKLALLESQPAISELNLKVQATFEKGLAAYEAKRDPDARSYFARTIRLDPNFGPGHSWRALLHMYKGEYGKAIEESNAALALDPEDALAYFARGTAYAQRANVPGAIADFNVAIQLDSRFAEPYFGRGWVSSDGIEQKLLDLSEAIRLKPDFDNAYYHRALIRAHLRDFEAAIADWSEAIRAEPHHILAHLYRGLARAEIGDFDGALQDSAAALKLNPRADTAYLIQGIVYQKQGNPQQAIIAFDEAVKLNPWSVETRQYRAAVHKEQGNLQQAAADYQQILERQPDHPEAQALREFIKKHG